MCAPPCQSVQHCLGKGPCIIYLRGSRSRCISLFPACVLTWKRPQTDQRLAVHYLDHGRDPSMMYLRRSRSWCPVHFSQKMILLWLIESHVLPGQTAQTHHLTHHVPEEVKGLVHQSILCLCTTLSKTQGRPAYPGLAMQPLLSCVLLGKESKHTICCLIYLRRSRSWCTPVRRATCRCRSRRAWGSVVLSEMDWMLSKCRCRPASKGSGTDGGCPSAPCP